MQKIPKDVLYFETGKNNPVTHRVKLGETFEVETQINGGPWIDELPETERAAWRKKLTGGNPSSGCIYVEGVKAGEQLNVEIGPIDLDPMGYTQFGGNNGAMPGWMNIGQHSKIVKIEDGVIHWSDKLKLPAAPMMGFIGVAPHGNECFHNGWGGLHGGNMDAQEITTGTTLSLRVNHDGALLHIGDMHAIQGDGEICGAGGIEASGRVRITCRKSALPSEHFWPRIETATHIGVIAAARPAEDSFRAALQGLLNWMHQDYGMPLGEAYLLLGQVLEARATAYVNPTFTYVAKVNKRYLPAK
jgi:amidase